MGFMAQRDMSYRLNLGWGGNFRGLHRVLGGPIKGYITNLVQGSYWEMVGLTVLVVVVFLRTCRPVPYCGCPSEVPFCR